MCGIIGTRFICQCKVIERITFQFSSKALQTSFATRYTAGSYQSFVLICNVAECSKLNCSSLRGHMTLGTLIVAFSALALSSMYKDKVLC